MRPVDPWSRSLACLRPSSSPRWWVADPAAGARWHPTLTQNPRHSRGPYFTGPAAVEFVADWLEELLRHRRRHGRGCPPGLVAREESWGRDPSRSVCVLVISGRHGFPAVYVKWLAPGGVAGVDSLIFISFHASTKIDAQSR